MKTLLQNTCITLFIILSSMFNSCSINEETFFSCDKNADKWVKDNLSTIQALSKCGWDSISDFVYQKAAYTAFSSKHKYQFWQEKIYEVMELDWNAEEMEHIYKLLVFLHNNPSMFEDNFDVEIIEIFAYNWINEATSLFSWSNATIMAICMDGRKMNNKNGDLLLFNKTVVKSRSETCDCKYNSYFTSCSSLYGVECVQGYNQCSEIRNCGFFWSLTCDGMCISTFDE